VGDGPSASARWSPPAGRARRTFACAGPRPRPPRAGLGFQGGFGGADLGQAALAAGQFGREFVPPRARAVPGVLRRIDRLRLGEERGHFRLQFPFGLGHPAVAHGLVLGGVGQDLRAVQGDVAQLDEPGLLAEGEHLGEQARERLQVLLPEGRNAVVVGVLVRRQHAVRDLLVGGPLDLAGGRLPGAVGVHQELHHQRRVVRRLAPPVADLVSRQDRGEV